MRKFIKENLLLLIMFPLVVFADQFTKFLAVKNLELYQEFPIIDNFFMFTLVENDGVAWNMLSGKRFFNIMISLIACVCILYMYFSNRKTMRNITKVGLVMVLSGAFGNMIDRILTGKVIDMIYLDIFILFKGDPFPTFNIADLFVTFGAAVFCIGILFFEKDEDGK